MGIFAHVDAWAIALLLAAATLAAWGSGYWQGSRIRERGGTVQSGKVDDAGMALFGLLLAFTFAMALGKHDQRRAALVSDSNAIGDFYTCAGLLPDAIRDRLQPLIHEYTKLRLDVARLPFDDRSLEAPLRRVVEMQHRMTSLVAEAVGGGTSIAAPLVTNLNAVTSGHAARLAAAKDRLPTSVVLLLALAAVISTGLIGLQQGAAANAQLPSLACFVFLVALVVYVTLDLNQPGSGWIKISQEPMERLLSSMTP